MLHLQKDWRHRHDSISPCLRALYSLEDSHGDFFAKYTECLFIHFSFPLTHTFHTRGRSLILTTVTVGGFDLE